MLSSRTHEHANKGCSPMFACSHVRAESRHRLRKRVLNLRIIACSGTRTTAVFARKTSLYLFSAKSTDRSLQLASRSPRNAARKVRILACSGTRTTAVFARKTSLYLFSAKSTDRSLRLASRSPRNAARKVRILACSGTRTTDSPRARSGRLHSLVLAAPAQRGPEVVPAKATCGWFWYF